MTHVDLKMSLGALMLALAGCGAEHADRYLVVVDGVLHFPVSAT